MEAIGRAGTRGTRKPGPVRRSRLRRETTEAWTNAKRRRNASPARMAIVSRLRARIAAVAAVVTASAAGGTSRPPTRARLAGRSPSRAMPNEVLIADVRFAFKAPAMEAIPTRRKISRQSGPPRAKRVTLTIPKSSVAPPQAVHPGHPLVAAVGAFARTAKKYTPYTARDRTTARSIPRGTVDSGRFAWSESWTIASNPWNAMKKIPAPRTTPSAPGLWDVGPTPRSPDGTARDASPTAPTARIRRTFTSVRRPRIRAGTWRRAK